MSLMQKLDAYERLMRLDKPVGILLLLWPTLWGLWVACFGIPDFWVTWIFVLGTILMRSAGCVFNDWADRRFDGQVKRTLNRPLVTGEVSSREALLLAGGLSFCAFLLILPLNWKVWAWSVPALFLAATYPFTKRFLSVPQIYLGVAFGFGIPMAFAAMLQKVPLIAWVMLLANILWVLAYDTEYAMVDREDDLKIGIKTSAITFGRYDVAVVIACQALFLLMMVWVGAAVGRKVYYFGGLAIAALFVVYQWLLIRERNRERCFKAFQSNQWMGAVIFLGLLVDYAVTHAHRMGGVTIVYP